MVVNNRGYTLAEVAVSMGILAVSLLVVTLAWVRILGRSETTQAALIVHQMVYRARMLAVHEGANHFVVLDPTDRTISLFEDSSTPIGQFDSSDLRVARESWPATVDLNLPPSSASLPNPLGGSTITDAWSLPDPSGGAWSAGLLGFTATPRGTLDSAAATPGVIGQGVMVFSNPSGSTVSVGIRGQFGTSQWYRYTGSAWKRG